MELDVLSELQSARLATPTSFLKAPRRREKALPRKLCLGLAEESRQRSIRRPKNTPRCHAFSRHPCATSLAPSRASIGHELCMFEQVLSEHLLLMPSVCLVSGFRDFCEEELGLDERGSTMESTKAIFRLLERVKSGDAIRMETDVRHHQLESSLTSTPTASHHPRCTWFNSKTLPAVVAMAGSRPQTRKLG